MTRLTAAAWIAASALALSLGGCANTSSDGSPPDVGPTDTSSGNGNPAGGTTAPRADARALFAPLSGILPFPTDLYFSGTTDGTLNAPANAFQPNLAALNALDGFSTTAPAEVRFSTPLDPASLTAAAVRVVQVTIDNATKATTGVVRPLVLGTDYALELAPDAGAVGTLLRIRPLRPLVPSTGATNNGYLVLLTNALRDATGAGVAPDTDYAAIKAAQPSCASITNATLNGVCRLTGAHLQIGGALGVPAASVVLSFSFSTLSVEDPFARLAALVPAQPIAVTATGLTTRQANAALQGKANLFVGTTTLPYYLRVATGPQDAGVLTTTWLAAGPPAIPGSDPTSRFITRFNPVPAKTADLQVPLLVTVPNATAAGGAGCPRPPSGWPLVIVQHGLGGDRSQALALADAFADACFLVAAIDLPLHGITSTANPLYQAGRERTFNLDLLNNATGAAGPDGAIDRSSAHFIQVASPLTTRDNLRQGEADLIVFAKSVANLDVTGDGATDVNPARIHYVGVSLGGIVGTVATRYSPGVRTATLAVPGGLLTQLFLDSPSFGPGIRQGLAAQGVVDGTGVFSNFFRDAQAALDQGDPVNHIAGAVAAKPIHLVQVTGDTVVPNSATARLVAAANLRRIGAVGPTAVAAGNGAWVNFVAGSHGTLLDPTASLAATVEMQSQTVQFAASAVAPGGPFLVITNPAVIQP
jgi:dienelactone hydrolase